MTLLIALLLNEIYRAEFGEQFLHTGWIVALYFLHIIFHSSSRA